MLWPMYGLVELTYASVVALLRALPRTVVETLARVHVRALGADWAGPGASLVYFYVLNVSTNHALYTFTRK